VLDLDQITPQIEDMARQQALFGREVEARIAAGLSRWRSAASHSEWFAQLPRERNEPRLALPTHEPLDHRPAAPAPPDRFAVLAVDGSQIEPDFHEVAPCYMINVGHALLRYGPGADGTALASEARLFWPGQPQAGPSAAEGCRPPVANAPGSGSAGEAEGRRAETSLPAGAASPSSQDDEGRFGSWGDLDAQRMLAEAEALARLMEAQAARNEASLAFLDGPLIAWRLDWITPLPAKQAATRNFLRAFEAARKTGVPLAGYISRTRSTDLVNLLKYSACETAIASGSFCPACAAGFRVASVVTAPGRGSAPCYTDFDGLLDRQLLARLLPVAGMRSPVFQSNSSVLSNLYGEHRKVGFFFLNTGAEIGRVEVPEWVWEDAGRLSLVHALVYDQVVLGRGYPIALSEAHEQAVVRASERQFFFDLVRRAYGRHDLQAEISAKALRKRGPVA
jgi:hypothetical protein